MEVDSGGEDNLDISDSEDEREKNKSGLVGTGKEDVEAPDPNRVSTLATTKVCVLESGV